MIGIILMGLIMCVLYTYWFCKRYGVHVEPRKVNWLFPFPVLVRNGNKEWGVIFWYKVYWVVSH